MSQYLLYQPNNQPFAAFPLGSSARALPLFPTTTWKKKAVGYYLRMADSVQLPLPAIVLKKDLQIFSIPGQTILEGLNSHQKLSYRPLLWMWNREYQRKRVYLWLENSQDLQRMAFVKIGQGKINEHDFEREFNALTRLHNQKITFNAPEPILFLTANSISFLLTSSLPSPFTSFSFLPWSMIDKHLTPVNLQTRKEIPYSQLNHAEWFKVFQTTLKQETIQAIKKCVGDNLLTVGFIHGDMGSENSFSISGQLWLIDWERSLSSGPCATDEVAHWIGKTAAKTGLGDGIIQAFLSKFINNTGYCGHDVLIALCYLTSISFPPAVFLFNRFKKENFSAWM